MGFRDRVLLVCAVALSLATARVNAAASYTITDLGAVSGATGVYPRDINEHGVVVGDVYFPGIISHAFVWSAGVMTDLGTLGQEESHARGINDHGMITGRTYTRLGLGTTAYEQAFVYDPLNGMTEIGQAMGFYKSGGEAINNAGQIAGWRYSAPNSGERPIRIDQSVVHTSESFTGISYAYDLNQLGQMAGYTHAIDGVRAFRWTPDDAPQILAAPAGAILCVGKAINDAGDVAGYWIDDTMFEFPPGSGMTYPVTRPYLYTDSGGAIDLGTFGGFRGSAFDINNAGQVVGYSTGSDIISTSAFLWTKDSGLLDLNTLIPANSGWNLRQAHAINNLGQIVGYGSNALGGTRGFVLTPIPEPHLLAATALAIAFLQRRRWNQFSPPSRRGSTSNPLRGAACHS